MKNCLCKLICKNTRGSGFFCRIPYPDQSHLLPVLVTTDYVIDSEVKEGNPLKISLNDDSEFREIQLKNRKIFMNKEMHSAFIEILPENKINSFLEIDNDLFKDDNSLEYIYKGTTIYVLHYPKVKELQ